MESQSVAQHHDRPGQFAFGLTRDEVERLRAILSREMGREVTMDEAWQRAIELVALFRMLLGPLPDDPEA